MQFSSRTTIAAHVLLCTAQFEKEYKVTSEFLAGSVNVNPVIIRKTLSQLKKAGLLNVPAGTGGATLAKAPKDITLLDIFSAVENEDEELFHFHERPNPACPVGRNVHRVLDPRLDAAKQALTDSLRAASLQNMLEDLGKIMQPDPGR
mgnify:CR=1 FL=1